MLVAFVWDGGMNQTDKNIVSKEIDGRCVTVDIATGKYFVLNETATLMRRCLMDGLSREEILNEVCQAFDVSPEQAATDLDAFREEMREKGLIEGGDIP
jgi:hypothetical protein